jgi:L-rhamnose isomerase
LGAWAVGSRATLKSLLLALLEPRERLLKYEEEGDYFARLALMEELKTLPFGALWDAYCDENDTPRDGELIGEIHAYEREVTGRRS